MTFLVVFVAFAIIDLSAPILIRLAGLDEFPQDAAGVRVFRSDVGYVRLPRTVLLVLASVSFILIEFPSVRVLGITSGFVLMFAWMFFLGRDILAARRNWKNRVPSGPDGEPK